ncbi:phosphate ABC transporter substrate-binding/OmpA family protein [Aestuariibius sp. HNIBRBA575]|uniref:phosphate ABC transporter substrate-binding/OmpA family protein n=1 Tax=Aestuariibius sp. HNIBRBA575 TaxID=3233343 RepID=UPI0034A3AB3A
MTRVCERFLRLIQNGAAIFAALFICATTVWADPVMISADGGFELSGDVLGFDGTYLRLETEHGEVTVDFARVTCAGADCPDPDGLPVLRLSGSTRIAEILLPALIEGFARNERLLIQRHEIDASHFAYDLTDSDTDIAAKFLFRSTTTNEGFADLLAHEADIVMAIREIRDQEADLAREVGLGTLGSARQARILAMDGIVPITSLSQPVTSIDPEDLARVFTGEITRWSELGGVDLPIKLHLPDAQNGLAQGFEDLVFRSTGAEMTTDIQRHNSVQTLVDAVSRDVRALGIAHSKAFGSSSPMALVGECGRQSTPSRVTLMTGDYPLTQPLFLYLPARRLPPMATRFLAWLRSADAQLIIRRAGFVDQGHMTIPIDAQGARFAAAIETAGPDIPLTELQRMVRLLGPRERVATTFRFEVGSTRLTALSRSNVQLLAKAIRDGEYEDQELIFVGFSDGRGPAAANRDLSSARADAVRREVIAALGDHIPLNVELGTDAFGEAMPMGCDTSEWGRQMNRRVELWVEP